MYSVQMRFGSSLSIECYKNSYKNTVAYPSLCRTSRGYQGLFVVIFFFFFIEPTVFIWGQRDVFVYLLCFLVARSMFMFAYLIF